MECLSIGETTRAFFRVETFDSVSEDAKNLYLSLSFSFSSRSPFSRTAIIFTPIFPPVLFCDVVESIYRGFPRLPARLLVLFSSSTIRAQVRSYCRGGEEGGTLSAASLRLRKTPTQLRERRFDKDQTERTEENNWSAFV